MSWIIVMKEMVTITSSEAKKFLLNIWQMTNFPNYYIVDELFVFCIDYKEKGQ